MKTQKSLKLNLEDPTESELVSQFLKTTIYHELVPRQVILGMIKRWLKENNTKIKLATESEMLERAHQEGLKTTKEYIRKHRRLQQLRRDPKKPMRRDGTDRLWRENPEGRIVYLVDGTLDFLRSRSGKGSGGWLNRQKTGKGSPVASTSLS